MTELGESFIPLLNAMAAWSQAHLTLGYVNPYMEAPIPEKP